MLRPITFSLMKQSYEAGLLFFSRCALSIYVHHNLRTAFIAEFTWTDGMQMNLVGCYYYGYVLCHILGGSLAFRYGFKRILLISSIFGGILSIIFPACVRWNYHAGVVLRVLLGRISLIR